jgi:hypothetical protein
VAASQGVANFTILTVNKIGAGYALQVSSSGLTSVTSNPLNVTRNGRTPSTLLAPGREPGHGSPAGAIPAPMPLVRFLLRLEARRFFEIERLSFGGCRT